MTELDLWQFINENNIRWQVGDNNGEFDIVIFPKIYHMEQFSKLVKECSKHIVLKCDLIDDYFVIWMKQICYYYDIDMDKVFCEE